MEDRRPRIKIQRRKKREDNTLKEETKKKQEEEMKKETLPQPNRKRRRVKLSVLDPEKDKQNTIAEYFKPHENPPPQELVESLENPPLRQKLIPRRSLVGLPEGWIGKFIQCLKNPR